MQEKQQGTQQESMLEMQQCAKTKRMQEEQQGTRKNMPKTSKEVGKSMLENKQ